MAPLIPAPVGTAVAVITTAPLVEGFHEHVAVMLGEDPEVILFLQPEIMMFFALKVTRDVTLTFAVIVTTCLKDAAPLNVNELKDEVSTTSVTVIEID